MGVRCEIMSLKVGDTITIKKIVRWGKDAKHPRDIDEMIVERNGEQFRIEGGRGDELWGDPEVDNGIGIMKV